MLNIYSLLRANGSIVVNKFLIHSIGVNEAILYSELASRQDYFDERNLLDDEGMFYNTQYDLQSGTGLGERAQRTSIGNLKKLGLIEMKVKGLPAKRYFKIVDDNKLLMKYLETGKKKLESLHSSTDTAVGGNLKLRAKQLDTAERSANNTNLIIQNNNTNKPQQVAERLLAYYLKIYKQTMGENHPKFTEQEREEALTVLERETYYKDIIDFKDEILKFIMSEDIKDNTLDRFIYISNALRELQDESR